VSAWHTEHQLSCPQATQIKEDLLARKNSGLGERSGTGQLVGVALSRARPVQSKVAPPEVTTPVAEGEQAEAEVPKAIDNSAAKTGGGSPSTPSNAKRDALLASIQRWRYEGPASFETLGDPIGNGSYGEVTKVRHKKSGETYAMKAVPKQKIRDQGMLAYLMREIRTQMQLTHPCIVQLHYYFEDEHHVLLLLEYASGGSLFSLLRQRQQLPEGEAARYYVDVAMALMHLHKYGIVHRDLKPENILMCGDPPKAKLADFGWCAELSRDGAPRNTFCGTWDYLSPEMVQSEPHDNRVDIWATGVLLFEMLTGRAPFSAASPAKATDRIIKVDLQVPGYVPPLAADLMQKLLVREPAKRIGLKEALKHPWVSLQVPGASLELTQSSADIGLKQVQHAPRQMTPSKAAKPPAPVKEVTADLGPRESPQSPATEAPAGSPHTASLASTLSMAPPPSTRHRGYSEENGSSHSVSSASTVQVPLRPKPSVMPWSDNTPTSIKEAGSRSSSKEASDFDIPGYHADAKRGLDFGFTPESSKGPSEMFHPDVGEAGLGFGFGICSRAGSKDVTSTPRRQSKDASPTASPAWHETETFAAIRDWLRNGPAADPGLVADASPLGSPRQRCETEHSGLVPQDVLSKTQAAPSTLPFKDADADLLSQTFASRVAHLDGRVLPQPKRKMASPSTSRALSARGEDAGTDFMAFARHVKSEKAMPTREPVDEVTKCHNALDSMEERLRRKMEQAMAVG